MPDTWFWSALVVLVVAGLAVRLLRGSPVLPTRMFALGRGDLVVAVVALLALGFHCAAMFFPTVVAAVPGTGGAAEAVRRLGAASQVAYWVPAVLLLFALRRAWAPLLVAETAVLVAVGATMFWDFGLPAHLAAIAASVAVTVAVLTTTTASTTKRPIPA